MITITKEESQKLIDKGAFVIKDRCGGAFMVYEGTEFYIYDYDYITT